MESEIKSCIVTKKIIILLKGFPAIITLTSAMTTDMYVAIWQHILRTVPELRQKLSRVVIDYERAMIVAVRQVLPHVQLSGCLFHYCQVSYFQLSIKIQI